MYAALNPRLPRNQPVVTHVVNGRLTTESGVPVSSSDRTGQTTVYFTPYKGNQICLWNGIAWGIYTFTEQSLPLGTLTSGNCYDVFGYLAGNTLALELLGWTNSTTRATSVTLQDGRYCKSTDKTRLYLGTFYTTSTTTTADTTGGVTTNVGGQRFIWNYYNRILRHGAVIDTADNWAYAGGIRQARGNAGNKVEFITGIAEDRVAGYLVSSIFLASNTLGARIGIGLNTTTAFNTLSPTAFNAAAAGANFPMTAQFVGVTPVGYNYLSWNEAGATSGSSTFIGDNGADGTQSGMQVQVWG